MAAKKLPGRPFKKGQSGNPAGRPKAHPEFREQMKQRGPRVLELLDALLASQVAEDKRFAVKLWLDFNIAKPAPTIGNENAEKLERIAAALRGDG